MKVQTPGILLQRNSACLSRTSLQNQQRPVEANCPQGSLSNETKLTGSLQIGAGSETIGEVNIRGPVTIGLNCIIGPDVYIGPYTAIGDNCKIKNAEIENSIVMKECNIESGQRITDSLIGNYSVVSNGYGHLPRGYKLILGERSFAQL